MHFCNFLINLNFCKKYLFLIYVIQIFYVNCEIYVYNTANKNVETFKDYEISVGSPIPDNGLFAYIMNANPRDACRTVEPPPKYSKNFTFQWFALVNKESYCKIETRINHVIAANFDGIIFYTNLIQTSDVLFYKTYEIPILLMTHFEGSMLALNYTFDKNYYVYISNSSSLNPGIFLLPFYIMIGICVIVIILFLTSQIITHYKERRKKLRHCLSKKNLKKILTTIYKKGDPYDVCAICLDEFVNKTKLRILLCGHAYHLKCIDPWLTKNKKNCPICKSKAIFPGITESECSTDTEMENSVNRNVNERTPLLNVQSETTNYSNIVFPNRVEITNSSNTTSIFQGFKRLFNFNRASRTNINPNLNNILNSSNINDQSCSQIPSTSNA